MKNLLFTISFLCLTCIPVSAQWYLFPGKKTDRTENPEITVRIPEAREEKEDTLSVIPESADSTYAVADSFVLDIPERIHISLILPLAASGTKPSQAMFDFYSGAMLAIKEKAENGTDIAVNVIDCKNPGEAGSIPETIEESDIVLYCADDIGKRAGTTSRCLVSPLGNTACDDSTIIRIATPWQCQIDNLVSWIAGDRRPGDEIIILEESAGAAVCDTLEYLKSALDKADIRYTRQENVNDKTNEIAGTRRFINVSGSEKHLFKQLQAASVQGEKGNRIAFYSTSRVRNLKGIEDSRMLYNASARIVAQYAIDYTGEECRRFIEDYRSLTLTEPTRFAFHGYDTAKYFLKACSIFGRGYKMKLDCLPHNGIQSKFIFDKKVDAALTNTATSRVAYERDLSSFIFR